MGAVGKLGLALRCGCAESEALWDVSRTGVQFVSRARLLDFLLFLPEVASNTLGLAE